MPGTYYMRHPIARTSRLLATPIARALSSLHRANLQNFACYIRYLDKTLADIALLRNEVDEAWKWSREQGAEVIDVTGKAVTTRERLRPSGSRPLPAFPSAHNIRLPSSLATSRSDTLQTPLSTASSSRKRCRKHGMYKSKTSLCLPAPIAGQSSDAFE